MSPSRRPQEWQGEAQGQAGQPGRNHAPAQPGGGNLHPALQPDGRHQKQRHGLGHRFGDRQIRAHGRSQNPQHEKQDDRGEQCVGGSQSLLLKPEATQIRPSGTPLSLRPGDPCRAFFCCSTQPAGRAEHARVPQSCQPSGVSQARSGAGQTRPLGSVTVIVGSRKNLPMLPSEADRQKRGACSTAGSRQDRRWPTIQAPTPERTLFQHRQLAMFMR